MNSLRELKKRNAMKSFDEVLRYSPVPASRATVRRYYAKWRSETGSPARCDMPDCKFYQEPLEWRGATLPLILDHINGNNLDNRTKNLRYLCPNCDAQQETRGGQNRGRVAEAVSGGYALRRKNGLRDFYLICEPGTAKAQGANARVVVASVPEAK